MLNVSHIKCMWMFFFLRIFLIRNWFGLVRGGAKRHDKIFKKGTSFQDGGLSTPSLPFCSHLMHLLEKLQVENPDFLSGQWFVHLTNTNLRKYQGKAPRLNDPFVFSVRSEHFWIILHQNTKLVHLFFIQSDFVTIYPKYKVLMQVLIILLIKYISVHFNTLVVRTFFKPG